jgi:hypothetical protein
MFFDDDENVKAMRETARAVGLVAVLVQAASAADVDEARRHVRAALALLGVQP